jgi:diguanylate cyclase (GGDEF)-like protein
MSMTRDLLSIGRALRQGSPVVVDVPPAIRVILLRRYIELSMRNGRLSLASFALLLFGIAYETPLGPRLAVWAALGAIYWVRVWRVRMIERRLDASDARSDPLYDVLALVASSAWGMAPWVLAGHVSDLNLFGALYAAFVASSLLAVTYYSALPASAVLVACGVLPLVGFMAVQGSLLMGALALGTLVCAASLLQRVASGHATLLQALAAERENAALVRELEGYKRQLESENAALGHSLRDASQAATRDALTGLFNRRHITAFAQPLAERVQAGLEPVVLCMIDVDHFKAINDRHGHRVGDEVLCTVATRLGTWLRESDCLARVGGEEFMAILRDCDAARGTSVAEALRRQTADHAVHCAAGELAVTVSVGAAAWGAGESFDDVIERADRALYIAKRGGRNRVELASMAASDRVDFRPSRV